MKYLCVWFLLCTAVMASDSPHFRGPNRDGVFPESGLLKSWPEAGPAELWSFAGLGTGYASVAVVDGVTYTTGVADREGFLFAIDRKGSLLWKASYGPEHHGGGYPGARSTPTVADGLIYVMSGLGRVSAFEAASGKPVWSVDTLDRFGNGSKNLIPRWGISESVLIDGDRLICSPGAPKASLVALDRRTGETIWRTESLSDISGYCSARIYQNGTVRQVVTMTSRSMVAVNPADGRVVWKVGYPGEYGIHAVTPVFDGNKIYVCDGYRQGGNMFEVAADGSQVKRLWSDRMLDAHHGGVVLVNGMIYGAGTSGRWVCLDAATGKVVKAIRGVGKGSVIYADGMLYGYGERGKLGLFDPSPQTFGMVSQFKISKGSGQHWAHPVISAGVLYIRRGDVMMAFNIRG